MGIFTWKCVTIPTLFSMGKQGKTKQAQGLTALRLWKGGVGMDNIHVRIKALRESCDYTQEYVGMVLGISQQAYSNYEMDKRSLPARHVIGLAGLYHVSTDYILGTGDKTEDTVFLDAEYVRDVSYQSLLDSLMKLDDAKRSNVLSVC